jgi:hypothetical protein
MSTEIKTIEGSCHNIDANNKFDVLESKASISLNRFYNGSNRGSEIQLTISAQNEYGTSYIHLSKEKCEELAKVLNECFDYEKYPSD